MELYRDPLGFVNFGDLQNLTGRGKLIRAFLDSDLAVNKFIDIASKSVCKGRCCIIQQSDKSLGIKQLTTTESTEHAEKRDKTARFAPL